MTRKFEMLQVDVFTKVPLQGNPCAIVFDADDLTAGEMLAIAKEMNLSETVFVKKSATCDFRPVYYTTTEEIPLAGHPTVATVHALLETGRLQPKAFPCSIALELTAGKIRVDIDEKDGDFEITMFQLKPRFMTIHEPEEIMPLFGLEPSDVLANAPIQTVSTGTPMLLIPVRDLSVLKRMSIQPSPYSSYRQQSDFFSPHLFCLRGLTEGADTFARHPNVPPDFEDPFTGSASGCMAAYLWRYGLIKRPWLIAEQGHWMERPGRARLEVVGPPGEIETVKLIGTAVTTIRGQLFLGAKPVV